MHDLLIRGGSIVDGTGTPRFGGDVAIDGGVITAVGHVPERGRREIDAAGLLVTPGWIDLHTHYDGQVSWDSEVAPSSWHGVTSIVMGNCGVGFAPAARGAHDWLTALMEGVEDIPGSALAEGLTWDWESLPEYIDAIDRRPHKLDIGVQVPHAPLRAYVMGERGGDHRMEPSADEIDEMYRLTKEALLAGAVGFTSSRVTAHKSSSGQLIGSLTAGAAELVGIGRALKETGRGVFQFVSEELDLLRQVAEECQRPLSFSLVQQSGRPAGWREQVSFVDNAVKDGVDMKAQVCLRPTGVLLGLQAALNPFMLCETYQSIADLPLSERVAVMRRPGVRARILQEWEALGRIKTWAYVAHDVSNLFQLGDPPNYEPEQKEGIQARADREGRPAVQLAYELLLQRDGRELLYCPHANYADYNLDAAREMALNENMLFGLSDGGAHVGTLCDASFPTYNVAYWARDRTRGPGLPLEYVVQRQTSVAARHVGWNDRGVIAPGYKADVNVIDFEALQLRPPHIVFDLPAGGRRFIQEATGYRYTICGGEITYEDGHDTGALPGRVVRGPQQAMSEHREPAAPRPGVP